jgi:hypothetical protein
VFVEGHCNSHKEKLLAICVDKKTNSSQVLCARLHATEVKSFVFIHLLTVQLSGNTIDHSHNTRNYTNSYQQV